MWPLHFVRCISFLWPLYQIPVSWVAVSDGNLFSHSSGGQEFTIKVWAGPLLPPGLREDSPSPPGFLWLQTVLALCLHHSDLCHHLSIVSSMSVPPLQCVSLRKTSIVGFRTHLDHPQ